MHHRSLPRSASRWLPVAILPAVFLPIAACLPSLVRADEPPLAERFLLDGRLAEGITALEARLTGHPDDDQARFGLAVTQFLRAVERLGQSLHRHGALGPDNRLARMVPFLRLPVPPNPDPAEVSYADVRTMLAAFVGDLAVAEKTLAAIRAAEVSLPLRFGLVRLDLDGDNEATEREALWRMQAALAGPPRPRFVGGTELPPPTDEELRRVAETFALRLDRGDAFWLQGYCHLLSALGEFALAHDMEACFDVLAPRLFARPKIRQLPAGMFREQENIQSFIGDLNIFADLIAAIHEMRFEVIEPERCRTALGHLEQVIRLSRDSWTAIEAETDDDHEWIPNAKQQGAIPGMQVSGEMIAGWREFLDEAEAILAGRRLVRHWRLAPGRGIDLRRVFLEPRTMDLVRWVQGAAAVPYVAEGECSDPEFWWRLQRLFRGQFLGFAIWFN